MRKFWSRKWKRCWTLHQAGHFRSKHRQFQLNGAGEHISLESIAQACQKLDDKAGGVGAFSLATSHFTYDGQEPRFPSGVEERTRLLHEARSNFATFGVRAPGLHLQDLQRQQELLASGAASTARLV